MFCIILMLVFPCISCLCSLYFYSGNGGRFSGGFDINVFQKVHETGMITLFSSLYISSCVSVKTSLLKNGSGLLLGIFLKCLMFLLILW